MRLLTSIFDVASVTLSVALCCHHKGDRRVMPLQRLAVRGFYLPVRNGGATMHAFEVGWYALAPRGDSHGIIKAQSGAGSTGTTFIGRYLEAWKYGEHRSICNRPCVSCRVLWYPRYSTAGALVVRKPARGSLPGSELHTPVSIRPTSSLSAKDHPP
jgi:hypothetical protein